MKMLSTILIAIPLLAVAIDDRKMQTGKFELAMTPVEIAGDAAMIVKDDLPPDEDIEWQVVVPDDYNPDSPPGLIVYVSPVDSGSPPNSWRKLLSEHNLIWIGADDSSNRVRVRERMLKALFAVDALQLSGYAINPERCYVAGFSGGGKTASFIEFSAPSLFKGAIYIAGVEYWDETPPEIAVIRENHHAFIVGTLDDSYRIIRRIRNKFEKAGVVNTELMTVQNQGHKLPPSAYIGRAIEYLDSRLLSSEGSDD